MEIIKRFEGAERRGNAWILHMNCADVMVVFVTDEIVRLRTSFDRKFPEGSYVLMTTAWADRLDPLFEGDRTRVEPVIPAFTESESQLIYDTGKLRLVFTKEPVGFDLYDAEGTLLFRELHGSPAARDANRRINHYVCMEEDDCYYGFGEKAGPLNKNHMVVRERTTDAAGYDPQHSDTLYKHIPFYIRLGRRSRKAVGLFYHNLYESIFNMGCERCSYRRRYTIWQADGGDIDLFLLGGDSIARIVDNYTLLTGRPFLLPKRALGYQGSSMYYPELPKDSDDAVLEFIDTIRSEGFPIDGFHLSSGYTASGSKRYVFTWNRVRFKDPENYMRAMQAKGAENVPNIKPGILLTHPMMEEFDAADVFVKDSDDPQEKAVGSWWGGPGAYWDFTKPAARELWKSLLKENLIEVGTNSIWNDNCEYDGLMDMDAIVDYDGEGGRLSQFKSTMSTLMCRLSNEAVEEHDADARPYSVCRSGTSGVQHYAQTWCGDNMTNWETLRYNIPMITGMGLSGQPNEGADVGGFAGFAPEEELFVRWVQQGIFQARFSIHSANFDNTVTEPWMYRGSTKLIRDAILLRYRFVPYLYSLEYEASQTGAPFMRALVYEFQGDPNVYDESFDYMFGRSILVANVLEKGATTRRVYLPKGGRWYDMNDHYRMYEGGQTLDLPVTLASIPMFLREGGIVVMADNQPMNMERDAVRQLHLIIAPTGRSRSIHYGPADVDVLLEDGANRAGNASGCDPTASEFIMYDDDGRSNDYRKGISRRTTIHVSGADVIQVSFTAEGTYKDTVETVLVEMIRREQSPYWVDLNGERMNHFLNRRKFEAAQTGWYYSQTNRAVLIKYPNPEKDSSLAVSFEYFDLIGM